MVFYLSGLLPQNLELKSSHEKHIRQNQIEEHHKK